MANTLIMIVEDKDEEALAAQTAIKNHFGISPDEQGSYMGLENVKEHLGLPDWRGYKVDGGIMTIMTAKNLAEAKKGFTQIFGSEETPGFRNVFPEVGIITDLMFPSDQGRSVQANGIEVILMALEYKTPVVVCSDTDHHEVGFVPKLAATLAPLHPAGKIPVILDAKNWDKAVAEVVAML